MKPVLAVLLALIFCASLDAQRLGGKAGIGGKAGEGGGTQSPGTQLANGWTVVQVDIQRTGTGCAVGASTCTFNTCATGGAGDECMAPTVAGSFLVAAMFTGNNVTISSASGGGGTWVHPSGCHVFDANVDGMGTAFNTDLIYNLSPTTGTENGITITLSGNSSGFMAGKMMEFLPPANHVPSFDACGTADDTGCTTSCNGAAVTISGTDLIVQCCEYNINPYPVIGGTSWSGPYIQSVTGDGIGLNLTSGAAPTMSGSTVGGFSGAVVAAIAFTSSAGQFTYTGSTNFSLANYTLPTNTNPGSAGQISCTPGCGALTIPSTTAGNLGLLIEGDTGASGFKLSTVTCTSCVVVIPTGANTCGANAGISCAYILSLPGSTTSITPTLTGSTTTAGFSWWEFHRATGSWTLDAQSSTAQTATNYPVSTAMSCTGPNDVIIQAVAGSGGVTTAQYMQVGFFPSAALNFQTAAPFDPSNGALLNSTNCGSITFPFEGGSAFSSNAISLAFK